MVKVIELLMFCCGTDISFCQVMRLKLQYRPEQDVLMKIKILGTFVTIKFNRWFDKERVWNSQADFFTSKLFLVGAFHSALFDTTSLQQNTFYIKDILLRILLLIGDLCIIENLHVTINFTSLSSQEVYCWVSDYVIVVHLIPPLCILLLPCASPYVFTENKEEEKWDVGHNKQCNHSRYFTATETETLLFLQLLSSLVTFRSPKKGVNFVFVCIRRQL